jgi:uncharacterized glyoxalase superfamily protein PhnB
MEFYHKVLGGNLDLQTSHEQGISKPADPGDPIMYSRLEADGARIIGVDGHPKYPAKVGENMAVALGGTDRAGSRNSSTASPRAAMSRSRCRRSPRARLWAGSPTSSGSIGWSVSIRHSAGTSGQRYGTVQRGLAVPAERQHDARPEYR